MAIFPKQMDIFPVRQVPAFSNPTKVLFYKPLKDGYLLLGKDFFAIGVSKGEGLVLTDGYFVEVKTPYIREPKVKTFPTLQQAYLEFQKYSTFFSLTRLV